MKNRIGLPSTAWIEDGEKYALVGLEVNLEVLPPPKEVAPNLWTLAGATLDMPSHWRDWLGSIRAEQVGSCNLFLVSKMASSSPAVLDAENEKLKQNAWNFYVGLLMASTFAPAHRPVMLTGSRQEGEIGIRQQQDFDAPVRCIFRPFPPVAPCDLTQAAQLATNLATLVAAPLVGGHWRLLRTLKIYIEARAIGDVLDRLHQYCRCIDGLILPRAGETRRQFRSRTELFIGPRHHDLMGEIYDVRSAVEHLHENRYLESFDRETRLDLVRKEAIIEHIVRTALARIFGDDSRWSHFANTASLEKFWALPALERQQIWGHPFDPLIAVADFKPDTIHNGMLGVA